MKRLLIGLGIWLLCVLAAVVSLVWMLCSLVLNGKRFMRIAVGFDCTSSADFGGDGYTTISKRAYQAALKKRRWGCVLCKMLDYIDPNHCENA